MIYVYWWSRVRENNKESENFGDALVPYILDRTTSERYQWIIPNRNRVLRIFKKKYHHIIIGSILRRATEHSVIWGAGIMFHNSDVPKAKFLAVRGPLTRKRLLDLGYKVPEYYGDPAILISLFNKPKANKKYELGIIPHFLDYKDVDDLYNDDQKICIINILSNDPQSVIDQINDCERILSSSLHGIIVAHALNIPALWFKISERLLDDIKFYDYYQSLKIDFKADIPFKKYSFVELMDLFEKYHHLTLPEEQNFDQLIKNLIETFPFRKSKEFKILIKEFLN
ncbi:polysaccharide pyruvyl transferase family protein [Christiangramia fulva]|uniref:Polysaccharide pyruvyl transferase family protein n=1 Tax=Christiangramia fulva TaxID=2126553 RepID=A0A2R3Z0T7_9FLAO|nr:polysaccharide pyruvyl transferase family protein [Christiangramia fulva]AVR43848.1 polysaccharide pyruvyl transferase family protein [Christiangramia fulva]